MKIRRLFGLFLLVICLGLSAMSVWSGISMAGFQAGLALFTGLGGVYLLVS